MSWTKFSRLLSHNRDGCIDAQLLVIQICSRDGKVLQRSIPSKNVVPNCLRHLPIHGGKEPNHPLQSLGLFGQKVRELVLLERGAI